MAWKDPNACLCGGEAAIKQFFPIADLFGYLCALEVILSANMDCLEVLI